MHQGFAPIWHLKFAPINIVDFLNGIVLDFIPLCKDKKISIDWNAPKEKLPLITGDNDHLRLGIQNLLDNALKYTPDNGTITISLGKAKNEKGILLQIKDSGVGIPKDEQKRIFTKFYRGQNVVKMQTDGSGLGLFIVKNIIERHNATITFESSKKGTTFSILFPEIQKEGEQKPGNETFQRFITQF